MITLLLILFLLIGDTVFANEFGDVAKDLIDSPMPIREKILLIVVGALAAAFLFFCIKILSKLADQRRLKIENEFELKNKQIDVDKQSIEIETNQIVSSMSSRMDKYQTKIEEIVAQVNKNRESIKSVIQNVKEIEKNHGKHDLFYKTYQVREQETRQLLCKIIIYNEQLYLPDRLEALNAYISYMGNHSALEYGMRLILKDKQAWWKIQHTQGCIVKKRANKIYYNKCIEEFKKQFA